MEITEESFEFVGPVNADEDDCSVMIFIHLKLSGRDHRKNPGITIRVLVPYKSGSTISEIHERARAEATGVLSAVHGHYAGCKPQ